MCVRPSFVLGLCAFVFLAIPSLPRLAAAQPTTTRVSVGPANVQAAGNSADAVISDDGRWVVFTSWADNLVPDDTNGAVDVFVYDTQTAATTRVSVGPGGVQGNFDSGEPAISADGRWVAFRSAATNLVAGDTNDEADIFVHDRLTGTTTRVSVATGGAQGQSASYSPSISADGRWVAFHSDSTLVPGDTNTASDVFVHDRLTGTTTRVSVGLDGAQANAQSAGPDLSADGRWVVFGSAASNLVANDTNGEIDVFVHDRVTGQTTRVNVGPFGTQAGRPSIGQSISADGRWIAFSSMASLDFDDTNNETDVYVHDRLSGTTTRVSLGPGGVQANSSSSGPVISADGRWVGFGSLASNLVVGDSNGQPDVFVHDRQTGTTTRVSVATGDVQANGSSGGGSVSVDGRVAFASGATNLVPDDTNDRSDGFMYDRGDALCGIGVAPALAQAPATGMAGQAFVVTAAPCTWTAVSSDPSWLTVTGGSSGTGAGIVEYAVAANVGGPRIGTIAIGGFAFTVEQAGVATPAAPTGLVVYSVTGSRVTLQWRVGTGGPAPTVFQLEGGLRPGETLVSVSTGSAAPAFAFDAPTGSFYARVYALNGSARSAASNEVRIHVNAPLMPSAPAGLIGLVDGTTVSLTWTNTYAGGTPASVVLEVTGATVAQIPLGLVDHASFAGVPGGTYRVAVRAVNAAGTSERSSTLTLTVPDACPGPPAVPVNLVVSRTGTTVTASWAPDVIGPAPTSYVLIVTGSTLTSCATTERSVSGQAGPGTYVVSVVAVNACGVSAGTPMQTIVVP
jgi:Tol biopolymer transport system component